MSKSKSPIPEGFGGITPSLGVKDVEKAIAYYIEAFGGTEVMRMTSPEGRIDHVEIELREGATIYLVEESEEWKNFSPNLLGGTPVRLHYFSEDVDAAVARAEAAGAEVLVALNDEFYGQRSGRVRDPFGHVWIMTSEIEELSGEEIQRRYDELYKKQK